MLKRRSGMSLASLSLYVFIIMVMAVFIIARPNPERLEDDGLKDLGIAFDTSLSQWYLFHSGTYPESLTVLVQAGIFPEKAPLHKFIYSTNLDKSKYRVDVILDGRSWATPGSNL